MGVYRRMSLAERPLVSLADLGSGPAPQPVAGGAEFAARVYDLVKVYGRDESQVVALGGVTLGFARGTMTAVMGPSGSGKSTLLHLLAGLDRVTTGRVFLGDDEITMVREKDLTRIRRDRLGFVFQSSNLVPYVDAEHNMRLPARFARRKVDEAWRARIVDTLGIADRLHHLPGELSGGQEQRVALARALISRPELLLGDEPTGSLDRHRSGLIMDLLRRTVTEFDQTIVLVTHDPAVAARADRAVFLADGRVVDDVASPDLTRIIDTMKRLGA